MRRDEVRRAGSPVRNDACGGGLLDPRAVAQAPASIQDTPSHRQIDSENDITLSPGELGGSQYIMSPGHELASCLQRSESTLSDGNSSLPKAVEEVAAMELQKNKQRLFPIFVRGRKIVHLIRHGQSTYNEAISGPGSWDEPNIFDAPLTKLGVKQAKSLGSFLAKLPKETVWVTSPLTRAMETCVHGYKASMEVISAQRRKGAAMREAAAGGGKSGGDGKPPLGGARVGCLTGASPAASTGQALVRAMRTGTSRVTPWSARLPRLAQLATPQEMRTMTRSRRAGLFPCSGEKAAGSLR